MPLTRRIQVFISEEASQAYDRIREQTGEGPTVLLERLLKAEVTKLEPAEEPETMTADEFNRYALNHGMRIRVF